MSLEESLVHKAEGNKAFSAGNFEEAIKHFSKAIECNPNDHVFFSNRSACFSSLGKYPEALADATRCVTLKPDWAKGYVRKGLAEYYLKEYDAAEESYKKGLELEPANEQCKEGLQKVQEGKAEGAANPFLQQLIGKLITNPKTAGYMKDPAFVQKLMSIQKNPQMMDFYMKSDPRIQEAFNVMFADFGGQGGADFGGAEEATEEGSGQEKPHQHGPGCSHDHSHSHSHGAGHSHSHGVHTHEEKKQEEPKKTTTSTSSTKSPAEEAKNEGNEAYKKRNFEEALRHYDRAIELDPTEYLIYNNKAAAYLELKQPQKAMEQVDKALEVYQEQKADFVKLAKLLHRKANIYVALEDYDNAIEYYKKSLLEDSNPKVKDDLKKAEKEKKIVDEKKYINPELAEQHKEKGNEIFKKGDFPGALKEYDEAIRRNPNDSKLYSNRATCLMKLMEFSSALKSIDKALELEPTFIKAWAKKGTIHIGLKEFHKAADAFDQGLKLDPNNEECKQGKDTVRMKIMMGTGSKEDEEERFRHAMADPEIQRILADPTIQNIMRDLQERPGDQNAMKALRDPTVAAKFEKLMAAGVIKRG
eukprot:CAMPEP_0176453916 /NCGR_PEP_ID=MMETSP0127-20121128/29553_1 /TAXON_ID=938130 /ORGANISM="Platyophrya macrostoma, Strain WH" /LENGTH=586 /DNA_ID=CAMNT_0017842927 /DNA_START=12 /DNA_END=1772 /DNA_ORIENTATION=+